MIEHIDRCLGCLACVTACPSGVEYGHLLAPVSTRARIVSAIARCSIRPRTMLFTPRCPYRERFKCSGAGGTLCPARARRSCPRSSAPCSGLLPGRLRRSRAAAGIDAGARDRGAYAVAFLLGCVQPVLAPQINAATVRVLARNGVEVIIPQGQGLLRRPLHAHGRARAGAHACRAQTCASFLTTWMRSSPTWPAVVRA